MSEKVIFTDNQIETDSKILDGVINFRKILGKVKVAGIFNIDLGKIAENNDRKAWAMVLGVVNSQYQKGKISDATAELITGVFAKIEAGDEADLISSISSTIAGKINFLNDDTKEETLIKSALTMLSTLDSDFLDDLNAEFEELSAKADAQDAE